VRTDSAFASPVRAKQARAAEKVAIFSAGASGKHPIFQLRQRSHSEVKITDRKPALRTELKFRRSKEKFALKIPPGRRAPAISVREKPAEHLENAAISTSSCK